MVQDINSVTKWAVAEIMQESSLLRRLGSKKRLVIKLGVDPTSPDLHLGHAVVLRKLRQFQDLGHQAVLVIGDFTARIGDPSGRNSTRPVLSAKEIRDNLKTYVDQAKIILDVSKAKIVFNSTWLDKLKFDELLKVASQISVNTLLDREDFASRITANQPLGLHELLYPISQAIDSVELKADVELGGWDQRLNLLLGRELQKKMGQIPQDIVVLKALIGLDGKRKMSKSFDNYIGLQESPNEMFGKVMSIPDKLIFQFAELAAVMSESEIKSELEGLHPRDQKARVANKIVALYYGQNRAELAQAAFDSTFRDKEVSSHLSADVLFSSPKVRLLEAVTVAAQVSRSQAQRLIQQKAVKLDGQLVTDITQEISLDQQGSQLQVGRHTWRNLKLRA